MSELKVLIWVSLQAEAVLLVHQQALVGVLDLVRLEDELGIDNQEDTSINLKGTGNSTGYSNTGCSYSEHSSWMGTAVGTEPIIKVYTKDEHLVGERVM